MSEKILITEQVIRSHEIENEDWRPLSEVIAWLINKLESIPEQYRESATIRCNVYGDYSSAYLNIEYERPETDEEQALRIAQEAHAEQVRARQKEFDERAQLARLKAKYGE